jgi:hypothetical protein
MRQEKQWFFLHPELSAAKPVKPQQRLNQHLLADSSQSEILQQEWQHNPVLVQNLHQTS